MNKHRIQSVPTNIITGFLGVGKTSAILHLLNNKPANERWAVLVNEFGEIGVDGSLFAGQHTEGQGVFIKEVPGGCMCCAAGVPMKVALNQLLVLAKPDRLLIEPTGLGHPREVLQVLSDEYYRSVLTLHQTITLVDARKLTDKQYTTHETFNQQIAIANVVVGNKQDLYQPADKSRLFTYVAKNSQADVRVFFTQHGALDLSQLNGEVRAKPTDLYHQGGLTQQPAAIGDTARPGIIKAVNQGEGFYSVGWQFAIEQKFNRAQLLRLFAQLNVERMKAVFKTDEGMFGYNLTTDGLVETSLNDEMASRVEIIAKQPCGDLEPAILACEMLARKTSSKGTS